MKKLVLLSAVCVMMVTMVSCSSSYTCPTYMKNTQDSNEVLVKAENKIEAEKI